MDERAIVLEYVRTATRDVPDQHLGVADKFLLRNIINKHFILLD
jgi:hypothetical protein